MKRKMLNSFLRSTEGRETIRRDIRHLQEDGS